VVHFESLFQLAMSTQVDVRVTIAMTAAILYLLSDTARFVCSVLLKDVAVIALVMGLFFTFYPDPVDDMNKKAVGNGPTDANQRNGDDMCSVLADDKTPLEERRAKMERILQEPAVADAFSQFGELMGAMVAALMFAFATCFLVNWFDHGLQFASLMAIMMICVCAIAIQWARNTEPTEKRVSA